MRIEAVPCPSSDNVPAMFSALIHRIQTASSSTAFIEELDRARCQQSIMSKTELGRWAGVLDRCDEILENATVIEHGKMSVDHNAEVKKNVVSILKFTALLFECTSTRRIYASMDRLLNLLDSSDLTIVADVLRLLQTIGKRSKYLPTRLSPQEQTLLVDKLTAIAQCWGGKLRNMKMVDTLNEETPVPNVFPFQYSDGKGHDISLDSMDEREPLLAVVDRITTGMDPLHRYVVVARLRMIRNIHLPDHRMHCLIIRLLSISTLIYCRCHPDENQINALVFPGFVDETAALLKVPLTKHYLVDQIQAESLRTLTAIVSLDKSQKVNEILDGLGANSYHGFIANFTRMLVAEIKTGSLGKPGKPSIPLATALFSFIYHVSNNDTGGEKLLSCGLTQTLLSVIEHKELCLDLLSFATRCCRIIDTFTTMDVASFRTMKGMNIFLDRIVHEVNECRKDQPFVIDTSEDTEDNQGKYIVEKTPVVDKRCHQLRVGLIKGLLTFVKRVISVPELQESVRHIMEGNFPEALIHIISNAEYYSDSVYHHTLQLVTNFIYQEPAQLTQLQGKHLPYVMLQSMLRKELPNSRDVIGSLGNVFTALCLNEAGLKQFMSYKPFEHIFKILLSIKFLATIKKKRAEMSDSASNIGVSLDDLLRHHPVLKASMLTATITALDILNKCATDSSTNTKIVMAISKIASRSAGLNNGGASGSNSPAVERTVDEVDQFEDGFSPRDDESDDDDEADLSMDEVSTVGKVPEDKMGLEMDCPSDAQDGSRIIPLGDYIIIFAKVFEQIISQSSTNSTEIIEGFVQQGGIEKLLELSQIQPIASELSASSYTNSIANILQNLLSFKPAGNRMMEAFIEVFSKRASPLLLSNDDDQINGSYLLPLGTDVISEATACIGTLTPILSNLTRLNAGPSQYTIERKGRVHEAWLTPTGKAFHQNLRRASRHLSWESTLIKLTENTRVSEGTQTDPVPFEKKKEGEAQKEETCVDSVAVEPSVKPIEKSPWEDAGIPQSVVDAWRREKNVADCVVKANKQILEFFNSLARSCYSPLRRNRRYEFNSYSQPKPSAQLAEDVFASIYQELKFSPKDKGNSPMEFGRISDTLAQLNLVLFDERRHGFHPMLDKFYSTGLHKAFCDVLAEKLAPALEGHVSAQLDGAFGDWFRLAGRLANRQKIVGTVYKQYGTNAFDPEKYTRLVQSDFFRVLSELFTKLSLPTVNLHNYQGLCEEAISVFKEVARSFVPSKFEATEPPRPQPREEQIQNLMEMGFEREEIMLAFHRAPSFEEATDYLISRQQQSLPLQPQQQQEAEDDSAVPFLPLAQREDDGRLSAGSEDIVSAALEGAAAPIIVPLKELKIDKDISISQACIELMPLCKRLMELGSELVFSCADLFISVEPTLDADWKINELLKNIMAQEVSIMATNVIQQSQEGVPEQTEVITLATRLHFCCLLFEHVAKEYLKVMSEYKLPSLLHHLLDVIEKHFDLTFMHDKLLPPAVLWLDLYDKFARLFERRDLLLEAFGNSQTKTLKWTWLGDDEIGRYRSNKKWVSYNTPTQEILTAAFFEGKSKVLIKKGDKETVVDFGLMLERENQSPRIMVNAELPDDKELVVNMARVLQSERKSMWTEEEITGLVKNLTRILGKGVLFTRASWSILSFLARLTRDKNCADLFIKQNGVCSLIRLRSSCTPCSTALISLILRQCIDTDDLLRSIFEKSVRQVTIVTPQMEFLGMPDSKPKEWYETLNKLMPLAVRQPDVFADVMSKSVTMKQSTSGNNELLLMQHVSKSNKPSTDINENMTTVVSLLLTEVLIGEWIDDKNIPLGYSRMLSRSSILNILSELIKTYQCAAPLVTDAKHENQKILLSLLEKYIAHEDKETLRSLKILIAVLASCNHSPKAQESLVSDIKTCIVTICETSTNDVTVLHTKLTELCSLISAMAENPGTQSSRSPSSLNTANPIMKLFHKKKVCNDLVKTITLLRFNHKEAIDTVSEILRTMEVLMRHINNPTANATVEDLVGQGRARADRGMFSFEEIFQSHLNEEERRRFEELDRRIFHPADGINRGLDQLREHVEAIERNFDAAFQNRGNVDDRPVEEAAEEDSADERPHDNEIRDENESSEEEPESGEEDEEGVEHDGGDLDMSQDSVEGEEPDATMEQEHQDERHDEGDTEEEEEEDEEQDDDDEDDDGDEDDDPYEQGFAGDRDRFEDIYDFGIDSMDSIMDDWDVFPHAYLNHYNRIRNRGRRPQNDAHPLLVRPHHLTDNQSAAVNTGHPYDYPNVVLGIQHVGHPGAQLALTRQNAIRRIGGTSRARPLEPRRMFFDRLFDVRDGHGLMTTGIAPREIDDQRLRATVPSALERIVEGSDLLESLSVRYIGILINTCVTKAAKDQLAAEKAAKEKADEEKKKKENEAKMAAKVLTDAANEASAATSSTANETSQTAVVVAPPSSEVAQAWNGEEGPVTRNPSQEEPMDMTDTHEHEGAPDAFLSSSETTMASSIQGEEHRPESPVQMDESTVPSDTPMDTDPEVVTSNEQVATQQPPSGSAVPPSTSQDIPEEFRAILGDIVVPEGVDVAFLAALPDDMRAEVLRDHERQQRAQRAVTAPLQPPAGQNAPVPVPVVEPLDQEFLSALPPDLQEEILQQHERAVREAEEAIRRANEPVAPAQPEMDGAAVIASLPPRERQQVLAEMDDAELQRLPQAMQDEARRARVHMQNVFEPIQRNVMRIHNLYVRQGRGPLRGTTGNGTGSVGVAAGRTYTANSQAMQLLDKESIIILCGLFLVDHRINSTRLQKVIRLICSHAPSCEFVIWCLQGFLDKASEGSNFDADDIISTGPGWLDSIGVPGLGLGERCAKISKNGSKVYVNPLISPSICRNVVDTLITLARCYPGHFLPTVLRNEQIECKNWPERSSFWQLLQNPSGKAIGKEPVDTRPPADQFSSCPFTHFFYYFNKKLFQDTANLQDKLFRVINTIAQTLPDNVIHRLGLSPTATPSEKEIKILIGVLSRGICGPDGFADGRSILMELMRVLSPSISDIIYDDLSDTITSIGLKLQPQIEQLMVEMNSITKGPDDEEPSSSEAVTEKGRVISARLAGESVVVDGDSFGKLKMTAYACAELRLPAMNALTDKHGAQYSLLSSLQTLTKLRDTMRSRKQKKIDDEKRKTEASTAAQEQAPVAADVQSAAPVNLEAQIDVRAPSNVALPGAAQEMKEAVNLDLISVELPTSRLSKRLSSLEDLWKVVSAALLRLGKASDPHAVLALQPAAEAFFLVHAVPKSSATDNEHPDNKKMIEFAEMHREVLNQVLRQNSQALSPGGPFAFLTQFPKLLDFDVKRKYFRKELTKMDNDREYRRADINVQVRRQHLFSDSFRELYRLRPSEWKKRFYIVFQGEEGQDAGGLLREWFSVITREIFNPNYALFITAPGDMVTYMINKASYINPEHLDYFKFVGKLIAKAIYDNKLLDCYFTRAFYKHILNVPVRYQDIESEDPAFFKSLEFLLNNPINDLGLDLTFSLEVEEFGVRSIRDLKENGRKIEVTDENKVEYVNLVCQMKMTGSIQRQLDSFLSGFYEIIPKSLISMFNEQELELLISGLPDVDIDDLANNTEYKSYAKTSPQIQWFWRALRSFEPEDRAKFLQFVTGTSKVPLQGFATLEGMNGVQKFSIHMDSRGGDRLPAAHTCFNQLDLPQYESYEKLRDALLTAIRECTTGFGFA